MRYFVEIAYDGTLFSGWQVQPSKQTVQGEINSILSTILQDAIHVVGCGRTDAGVHASQFYFHFDTVKILPENILYKLNSMLPSSIVAYQIFSVENELHSRFSATKRSYVYHTHFSKNPFQNQFSYYCYYKNLDRHAMQTVVDLLKQTTDFAPLSKFNEDNENTLCTIYSAELLFVEEENRMELHITANRFLHNMIRRIMGLLLSVGRGKLSLTEVKDVLGNTGTFSLNFVAPPQGLFLNGVEYAQLNERQNNQ